MLPHRTEKKQDLIILRPVWPTVHTYPVKIVTERISSTTLLEEEVFENAVLLYSYGWMKTEVFENDLVKVLNTSKCACSHQRWYLQTVFIRYYVFAARPKACSQASFREDE